MNKRAINAVILVEAEDFSMTYDVLISTFIKGTNFKVYAPVGDAPFVISFEKEKPSV